MKRIDPKLIHEWMELPSFWCSIVAAAKPEENEDG